MTTEGKRRARFCAPLAAAALAVSVYVGFRVAFRIELPGWAYALFFAALALACWKASWALSGMPAGPAPTARAVAFAASAGAGLALLHALAHCAWAGQPAAACLARSVDMDALVVAVVAAPFIEETLLRGYLRQGLGWMRLNNPSQWVIQGLLFALIHGGASSPSRFALFFAAGFVLSVLASGTDGLAAPVAFHLSWNLVGSFAPADLRGTGLASADIALANEWSNWLGAVMLLGAAGGHLLWVRRRR